MQCLRIIGSYSVTALAVAKALLLGDMPKRHVGYALTLSAIAGLIIARIRSDLLDFELVHLEWKVKKISIMCISNIAQVFVKN